MLQGGGRGFEKRGRGEIGREGGKEGLKGGRGCIMEGMSETKERKREVGLRVIGLCRDFVRGLERGSEGEREACRLLAVYRESFRRETGEVATELMVIEAMRRRRVELEGKEAEAVANSCNQYKHEPGCRKGFDDYQTREELKKEVNSYERAREELRALRERSITYTKRQCCPIPGMGAKAPGMDEEFYVTGKSISELMSGKHAKKSADLVSHLTAAANVDYFWQHSIPYKTYRDKKLPYEKSDIEWIHKRKSYMKCQGKEYEIEITAKEFKKIRPHVLYQVKTKAIK